LIARKCAAAFLLGVSVSTVGGIFVHKRRVSSLGEKSSFPFARPAMLAPLPPDKEAEALQLAATIATAIHDDLLRIARTLVATDRSSLFGATEFTVRDLALGVAATAYEQHLAQKKTATTPPG
jgi:hypothetical protein